MMAVGETKIVSEFLYHKNFYRPTYALWAGLCCSMKISYEKSEYGHSEDLSVRMLFICPYVTYNRCPMKMA